MGTRIALFLLYAVASLAGQSSFEGTIVDAATGQPLRKADIQVSGSRGSRASNTRVISGLDGHFAVAGLAPGEYKVHVERQGYLDCDCLSGVKIGTGQKITGVQIQLTQYGAISGRVVDVDGDAWPHGSVEVYRLDWQHGKRKFQEQDQADVDDRGMFRVGRLPPGRYFLAAQPGQPYQMTFYPGTLDPSAAVSLQLGAGQETNTLEFRLQTAQTFRIRGRISGLDLTEFSGRTAGSRLNLGLFRESAVFDDWLSAPVDRKPDGTFEFRDVPSGSYTIKVQAMSGGFTPSMVNLSLGETAVQVNGHDVDDVMVDAVPPRPLTVSVRVEGVEHPDLSSVSLVLSSEGSFAVASAEGGFNFPRVAAEAYQVRVQGAAASQYFVKSVRAGSVEFDGPTLDVRRAGDAPVTITLSDKGASIEAVIQAKSPDAQRTTVLLLPDVAAADKRELGALDATPDHHGVFKIHNIPPGNYRLFAWLDLPGDVWRDADFWNVMREKGAAIQLGEAEQKSVELPLISAAEISATLARLGLQ